MKFPIRLAGRRRALALAGAGALVAVGLVAIPATIAQAAVTCSIAYTQAWSNSSQFGANVVINNTGDAVSGWTLTFNFPNGATIQNGWPVSVTQSGATVTIASNADWNRNIPSGGQFTAGFNANGQFAQPSSFTFNGVTCGGGQQQQALVVNPLQLNVPEGGNNTFSVRLQTAPTANVTVTTTAGTGDANITVAAGGTSPSPRRTSRRRRTSRSPRPRTPTRPTVNELSPLPPPASHRSTSPRPRPTTTAGRATRSWCRRPR